MGGTARFELCSLVELATRLGRCTATERLRVAHALDELPELHGAFKRGELSYSKVRAVTRVATVEDDKDWLK